LGRIERDDFLATAIDVMTLPGLSEGLARAEQRLFSAQVLEAFIARREAGQTPATDEGTAEALADELLLHQSPDGSWGGSLALTAESLALLGDLDAPRDSTNESVTRALAWIRSRQRAPGAWAQECTPDRHDAALCPHFTTGFFSPGPRTQSFAGTCLSTGARFTSDDDARLALSAYTLRVVLRYERPLTDDLLQIEALRRLAALLFRDRTNISTPAAVTVLATLAVMPRSPSHVAIVHGALSRLAGSQRGDGSWPGAEMFHVADALMLAERAGYGSPVFDAALARTANLLILTQQPDGSWGNDTGPYRLLTGWRTLRHVAATQKNRE
jgi:hypothetical protein